MQGLQYPAGKCAVCLLGSKPAQQLRPPLLALRQSRQASSSPRSHKVSKAPRPRKERDESATSSGHPKHGTYSFRPGEPRTTDVNEKGRSRPGKKPVRLPFREALEERLKAVRTELKTAPIADHLPDDGRSFGAEWTRFVRSIPGSTLRKDDSSPDPEIIRKVREVSRAALRTAYAQQGNQGLDERLKYEFYTLLMSHRFTQSDIQNQQALADLRYPTEWYPATRAMHRTVHLHVGPTNSGKTYHALKKLEEAKSGVYAGPLRLLAHEIYTRLNAKGKRCTLVTGEERRSPDDTLRTDMSSCTVEMMPLNKEVEVAVIDEIQMIGNADRGWAWTQALLGVKAKEVHLCGEARSVPLIREICASIGEKLEIHEYTRLSPLQMAKESLNGNLKGLRKGDAVVSFSVMGIHALRRQIEAATGRKVATIYGSLPPETRAQQARLFNDPDNDYDFLVASDAIGMGLNLSIKRVIFETSYKFNGLERQVLPVPDIKQIGGRAGRYKTAHQAVQASQADQDLSAVKGEVEPPVEGKTTVGVMSPDDQNPDVGAWTEMTGPTAQPPRTEPAPTPGSSMGLVTTLEKFDFPIIAAAMQSEPGPLTSAGLFPPASVVEKVAQYFPPGTPFSFVQMHLHELCQMHPRFHLCGLRDQLRVADMIEPVRGLTITDRIIFCAAPASKADSELFKDLMPALARCVAQQEGGSLLDIKEMPLEVLDEEVSANRTYLRHLERLHKGLVVYLWLSYRFAGIFTTRPLAFHVKGLVEEKIERVLSQFSFTESQRRKITASREKAFLDSLRNLQDAGVDESRTDHQTSLTAGGDHFSGESELDIMDPVDGDDAEEAKRLEVDVAAESDPTSGQLNVTGHDGDAEAEDEALESPMHAPPASDLVEPAQESAETNDGRPGHAEGSEITKHLHLTDANTTEVERDLAARP